MEKDYFYPLPDKLLFERYKKSFESLAKGNSATLWGFPLSCNFAFLRFVFSQKNLLQKLIPHTSTSHLFLFLDFDSLPEMDTLSFHKHLLNQLSTLVSRSPIRKSELLTKLLEETPSLIKTHDPYIMFQHGVRIISQLLSESPVKIVFIVHDLLLDTWDEAWGRNLYRLWHIHRRHPDNRVAFLFVTKPYITPEFLPPFLKPLRYGYFESVSFFPLFNEEETYYTLERNEYLYGGKLDPAIKKEIWEVFGGYQEFYIPAVEVLRKYGAIKKVSDLRRAWFTDENLLYYVKFLFDTLPEKDQIALEKYVTESEKLSPNSNIYKLGVFPIPKIWEYYIKEVKNRENSKSFRHISGLPPDLLIKEKLTAAEYSVLTYLASHSNTLVAKDKIGEVLWGDDEDAYSDWAIDKLISRLRSKIATPTMLNPLFTVRGKGYKLILS